MKGHQAARPQRHNKAEMQSHRSPYSNSWRNCPNTGLAAKATGASCKPIIPRAERREPHGPKLAGSSASQGTSKTLTCPCPAATATPAVTPAATPTVCPEWTSYPGRTASEPRKAGGAGAECGQELGIGELGEAPRPRSGLAGGKSTSQQNLPIPGALQQQMLGVGGGQLGINLILTIALPSRYYRHPQLTCEKREAQRIRKLLGHTAIQLCFQIFTPGLQDSKPASSFLGLHRSRCCPSMSCRSRPCPPRSPPDRSRRAAFPQVGYTKEKVCSLQDTRGSPRASATGAPSLPLTPGATTDSP